MAERLEIPFGENRELPFLVSGFTGFRNVVREEGDPLFRNMSDVAVISLPLVVGEQHTLSFHVSLLDDTQPQEVFLVAENQELGRFSLKFKSWQWLAFTIPSHCITGPTTRLELHTSHYYRKAWEAGCLRVSQIVVEGAKPFMVAPTVVQEKLQTYWGDLHLHSNRSECANPKKNPYGSDGGTIPAILKRERDVAQMDFAAITDHIDHIPDEATWLQSLAEIEAFHNPGRFVSLPGYEWTSSHAHGHRCVYYKHPSPKTFDHIHALSSTPQKLWKALSEASIEALTIPHHPNRIDFPMDWNDRDDHFQPLVEMYSQWGNCESYGAPLCETAHTVPGLSAQDALTRGHILGFVGGSDGHIFGLEPHTFDTPHNRSNRGLTAVLSKELTRVAIFEALQQRRCYATTGVRIGVDFKINGHLMGSVIRGNYFSLQKEFPLCITAQVTSDAPLSKVEIVHNGRVLYTYDHCLDGQAQFAYYFKRQHPEYSNAHIGQEEPPQYAEGRKEHISFYDMYFYLRVTRVDRHMAWSSPIFIRYDRT